ncbi:TPA: hypothetical protein RFN24_002016 [Klebsiella aerogenes]|nr:hypothetical protein [Klebsiella aerogenes]
MKIELTTLEDIVNPEIIKAIDSIKKEKLNAIKYGDEEKANECWRVLKAFDLNVLYIRAFNNIKNKKYRDAWNELEQCEINYEFLNENSTETFLINTRSKFIIDKVLKWQSLYPYCLFISPGFKVGYYTCSICDHRVRPRSRCGHKKGKIYNGELCLHIAHDMEFLEVSIVSTPAQKYSVMHDDATLDFTLIQYISNILENAFEEWDLNRTTMRFPKERFENVRNEDDCPCKSGREFHSCCSDKKEIEIPHIDFILSKAIPSDKEEISFPY